MSIKASIQIDMTDLVSIIKRMPKSQLKALTMQLTGEESELKKRVNEIKNGKVKLLSKKEIFSK